MKNAGLILESTRQENGSFRINVESCGEFSEGDAGAHVLYLAQIFAKAFRCPGGGAAGGRTAPGIVEERRKRRG